jgi:hypothetical protein
MEMLDAEVLGQESVLRHHHVGATVMRKAAAQSIARLALMIGALMIHGITRGPQRMSGEPELFTR